MLPVATRATRRVVLAVSVISALVATGCGDQSGAEPTATATAAARLTVQDPWVKATDSGMTAAFGVLVNGAATDLTVTGVTSAISPVEIHEMAMQNGKMVMRPKMGGIVIKAGSRHELKPGGDHLMLMSPSGPVKPGDRVEFTLLLGDRTTVAFTAIAKPFAGAGETYAPGSGMGMHTPTPSATS